MAQDSFIFPSVVSISILWNTWRMKIRRAFAVAVLLWGSQRFAPPRRGRGLDPEASAAKPAFAARFPFSAQSGEINLQKALAPTPPESLICGGSGRSAAPAPKSAPRAAMKILVLEDNAAMREIVAEHLTQSGFVVDAVGGGDEAISAVRTARYDAMVLDLGLPDLDGMEVLRQVRLLTQDGLPALIVTARDSLESRLSGLNAGADDYIVKPFALAEMEARLRAVLRRPGPRASQLRVCGRLTFDSARREASVEGVPLDLTRRELDLLEELLRAAGRIVVKDALEDRLYSLDQEGSRNAVEAAVSRLRKKLQAAQAGVSIQTKRGVGYRLTADADDAA